MGELDKLYDILCGFVIKLLNYFLKNHRSSKELNLIDREFDST